MELSEFVLEHSSELFFPIIPSAESEQLEKQGLKFHTCIGCDEIMQFIDDELIKSYSAEESFDLRIELRQLYNLMSNSEIDALPFGCLVTPFDFDMKHLIGNGFSVAKANIDQDYVHEIEFDLKGEKSKYDFIVRKIRFFRSHIISDLTSLESRWNETKSLQP